MILKGAGTIGAICERGYVTGWPYWLTGFAIFRKQYAPGGEYQCRLWPADSRLIHEYQTDSSSKPPAP